MAIALCHNGESLSHSGVHIRLGTTGTHENGLTPRWGCPFDEMGNLLNQVHLWGTDTCHKLSCLSESWNSKHCQRLVCVLNGPLQQFDGHRIVSQFPQVLWSSR